MNSRPLPYQGIALPLSYYSNCLRVIRRESSATQVKTRRVFFDDVSRRHDAKPKDFGTGSGAEQRDQRLKQALKSNLAKRKGQAKAKAGRPVEAAAQLTKKD